MVHARGYERLSDTPAHQSIGVKNLQNQLTQLYVFFLQCEIDKTSINECASICKVLLLFSKVYYLKFSLKNIIKSQYYALLAFNKSLIKTLQIFN